jgi:hypothetical protein
VKSSDAITLHFNSVDVNLLHGSSRAFQVYDSPLLSGTGLMPEVIAASPNTGPLELTSQPVVIGPSPSVPGVSEGGSIPIHAIFADFRKDSQLASGVKAIDSPAGETSVASLASARQHSMPDNAITGEWARAMVFEIAGGEPTNELHTLSGQPTTTSNSNDSLQQAQPLSSVETPGPNGNLASRHAASQANEAAPRGEAGQLPPAPTDGQVAAIEPQLLGEGNPSTDALAPVNIAENPDAKSFAAAAVFDKFGKENSAMIERRIDGKLWLRSIGTSPLLMVLALERIAALNSRRATRESRIAATKQSLRPRP